MALFRGRPNTHTSSRYALPRMVNGSKQIDMGLVWYMAAHDHLRRVTPSLAPLSTVEEVPMERHPNPNPSTNPNPNPNPNPTPTPIP